GDVYKNYTYVHIGPYTEDLARTYTQAMNGELPDSPLLVVGQPETADTNRTPEGKYTLWIQVRALPSTVKKDSLGEILPANWDHLKEQYSYHVIDQLTDYDLNQKEA